MVFICASCNGEFATLEEMEEHWRKLGLKVKTHDDKCFETVAGENTK